MVSLRKLDQVPIKPLVVLIIVSLVFSFLVMVLILLAILVVPFSALSLVNSDVYCLDDTITFRSKVQYLLSISTERSKH